MKKLMIAFAAVAMAAVASASTVSWGITGGLDSTTFDKGNIYLLTGGSIKDLTTWAKTQTQFTIASVSSELGGGLAVLNTAPNTIELSAGQGKSTGNTVTSYGDSKTGNLTVYVVAIDDDGKNLAVATATKTMNIRAAATPANALWTSGFSTYTAAPEPTSAMLLLLGVAGLALKRRRA